MDSMRNLNRHLPKSSTQSKPLQPSAELLQAFKSAALAVTQLYKTAASDGDKDADTARAAGYQAALDELLEFLDQEDLGLGDGEGWRVRQWATERLSAEIGMSPNADGEPPDNAQHATQAKSSKTKDRSQSPADHASTSANQRAPSPPAWSQPSAPPSSSFDFRSQVSMPSHLDMDIDTSDRSTSAPPQHPTPRSLRKKPSSRDRPSAPSVISLGSLGAGAGAKRKLQLSEFFDLSGLSADMHASKKGRLQ